MTRYEPNCRQARGGRNNILTRARAPEGVGRIITMERFIIKMDIIARLEHLTRQFESPYEKGG